MRFKARLESSGVRTLLAVVTSVDKLGSEAVVHLSPRALEVRRVADGECAVQAYCSVSADLFSEWRIESKADNCISLLLGLQNLQRALRSADGCEEVVLKLASRDKVPCLSVEAEALTGLQIQQDVPIKRLITKDGLENWREPAVPGLPLATSGVPSPRSLRTVLERMRSLDSKVIVEFNAERDTAVFKVQTEVVCMRTFFQGVGVELSERGRKRRKAVVVVSIADLLSALHFGSSEFDKAVFAVLEGSSLVLYVTLGESQATMTFYLPLVDPNDMEE